MKQLTDMEKLCKILDMGIRVEFSLRTVNIHGKHELRNFWSVTGISPHMFGGNHKEFICGRSGHENSAACIKAFVKKIYPLIQQRIERIIADAGSEVK